MALTLPDRYKAAPQTGGEQISKAHADALAQKALRFVYRASYFTGRYALRAAKVVRRQARVVFDVALSEVFRGAGNMARNLSEFKRSRAARGEISFTGGVIGACEGIVHTAALCREAFVRGGFQNGFAVAGRFIHRGAARFFAGKKSVFNYLAPAAALGVLAFTAIFWTHANFALAVSYDGKNIGTVASEQVFRTAADAVEQNVSDASGGSYSLDGKVTMKLTLAKQSDLQNEDQVYNNIVMKSCADVQSGYGLYVDNRLAGVCSDSGAIEAMLRDMTKSYKKDDNVTSVGFGQQVEVRNGLFPNNVFKSVDTIRDEVTGKADPSAQEQDTAVRDAGVFRISMDPLLAMNLSDATLGDSADGIVSGTSQPKLTVKVVKEETYTKAIPYNVVKTESASLKAGKTTVKVNGANGVSTIVAAVTYVDGQKIDEEVLSTATTTKPVDQQVVVGTKKTSKSGPEVSSRSGGLIGYAQSLTGIPYVSGGRSRGGFDCSGLTSYVFSKYGVSLPHSAAAQSAYGSYVSRSALQKGDLVFFDTNGGHSNITHVGIYIGGGKFVDASSSRPHAVTVDSLNSNYYSSRYMTARRVLK